MSDQVAQIAERIRELREISGRTVEQVATLISIPVADYEALEAGTYDVPISVLLKLSSLYHVDTNTILTGEAPKMNIFALTRKGMGVDIDRRTHYHYTNLAYNFAHRKIEPLLVTLLPQSNPELKTNSHSGHEFDYVLEGRMRIVIDNNELILEPGDCVYYESLYPHAMQAADNETVKLLAMVIP